MRASNRWDEAHNTLPHIADAGERQYLLPHEHHAEHVDFSRLPPSLTPSPSPTLSTWKTEGAELVRILEQRKI